MNFYTHMSALMFQLFTCDVITVSFPSFVFAFTGFCVYFLVFSLFIYLALCFLSHHIGFSITLLNFLAFLS